MAKEASNKALKRRVTELEYMLERVSAQNEERKESILGLLEELHQQTSDKAQLIAHLDDLGYEVLLNGVKVHVVTDV